MCDQACDQVRCWYPAGIYLLWLEAGGYPSVLFQGAAGVVVGGGVPLEVVHELGDRLLHLHGHGRQCMLLSPTLTVHTDLPEVEEG